MKLLERASPWISEAGRWLRLRLRQLWTWLKYRPLLRCPICKGKGGWMDGYEVREWSECFSCYCTWSETEDCGMDWTVGRLSVRRWLRAKALFWLFGGPFGPEVPTLRRQIACRVGWHRWMNEDDIEPGLQICAWCYECRHAKTTTGPEVQHKAP